MTITQGVKDLRSAARLRSASLGRVRNPGGGRKKVEDGDPALRARLKEIVEETTAGDPMSPLKWTSKSTRTIRPGTDTVGPPSQQRDHRPLEMDYTLQANVKTREGAQHPDRDAQFRYLNRQVKNFRRDGSPVISVDTKKKELVGAFKNEGRRWLSQGKADVVSVYDFPHLGEAKAIPYGAYDIARDRAVVNVGVTPRYGRVRRGEYPALVAVGRKAVLSGSGQIAHLRRQRRQQRESPACLETPPTST